MDKLADKGTAEREAAIDMVEALIGTHRVTGPARTKTIMIRRLSWRPCVVPTPCPMLPRTPATAIHGRSTRHEGYKLSQIIRKRIEECFGWGKTIGGLRKIRFVGLEKLDFPFVLTKIRRIRQ